jgi:hypothetical protein
MNWRDVLSPADRGEIMVAVYNFVQVLGDAIEFLPVAVYLHSIRAANEPV